jgi:hypothetical protein
MRRGGYALAEVAAAETLRAAELYADVVSVCRCHFPEEQRPSDTCQKLTEGPPARHTAGEVFGEFVDVLAHVIYFPPVLGI